MRRWIAIVGWFLVCGGWHALPEPPTGLATVEDEVFAFPPSVTAEMTWSSPRSPVGWGSFDLTANPETDEIRVDLLMGTPADRSEWTCGGMTLEIDGEAHALETSWAGVPMESGVFDAVTAKLSIEHVREMARAKHVRIELCGDGVVFESEQRASLDEFVRRFDDLAIYEGPSLPSPPPELGPEHEWDDGREWMIVGTGDCPSA